MTHIPHALENQWKLSRVRVFFVIVFQLSFFFQFTYESLLNYVLAADMEFGLFRFPMWTLSWPKGKAHFRYEITPKTKVHEKEKISSNSGHILGYANLDFENNITLKWASQNTTFP